MPATLKNAPRSRVCCVPERCVDKCGLQPPLSPPQTLNPKQAREPDFMGQGLHQKSSAAKCCIALGRMHATYMSKSKAPGDI